MAREIYLSRRYCGHCQTETQQTDYSAGHERDSTNDWQWCHVCQWVKYGFSSNWSGPIDLSYVKPDKKDEPPPKASFVPKWR